MALKLKFVQKVSLSEDRVVFELLSILDFVHSFIIPELKCKLYDQYIDMYNVHS